MSLTYNLHKGNLDMNQRNEIALCQFGASMLTTLSGTSLHQFVSFIWHPYI